MVQWLSLFETPAVFGELFVSHDRIGHIAYIHINGRSCITTTSQKDKPTDWGKWISTYGDYAGFRVEATIPWEHRKLQPRCSTKTFQPMYKITYFNTGLSFGGTKMEILRRIMDSLY
jgi:hypothetical protein